MASGSSSCSLKATMLTSAEQFMFADNRLLPAAPYAERGRFQLQTSDSNYFNVCHAGEDGTCGSKGYRGVRREKGERTRAVRAHPLTRRDSSGDARPGAEQRRRFRLTAGCPGDVDGCRCGHDAARRSPAGARAGRLGRTISAYERPQPRWPDRPDAWYNLALLRAQGAALRGSAGLVSTGAEPR